MWWPFLLKDQDEMSNLYRGPAVDASNQVLFHLVAMFVNGSELNEQSLERTCQGCFLLSFKSFGKAVL
jgi:hypothetical protein